MMSGMVSSVSFYLRVFGRLLFSRFDSGCIVRKMKRVVILMLIVVSSKGLFCRLICFI